MTLGCYSAGPKGYTANWKDHLFVHEYGHYIQSQWYGLSFLPLIGLPSFFSGGLYKLDSSTFINNQRCFEVEASIEGAEYFYQHYSFNPIATPDNLFDKEGFFKGKTTAYMNPRTFSYEYSFFPDKERFHWSDILIHTASLLTFYWFYTIFI